MEKLGKRTEEVKVVYVALRNTWGMVVVDWAS